MGTPTISVCLQRSASFSLSDLYSVLFLEEQCSSRRLNSKHGSVRDPTVVLGPWNPPGFLEVHTFWCLEGFSYCSLCCGLCLFVKVNFQVLYGCSVILRINKRMHRISERHFLIVCKYASYSSTTGLNVCTVISAFFCIISLVRKELFVSKWSVLN